MSRMNCDASSSRVAAWSSLPAGMSAQRAFSSSTVANGNGSTSTMTGPPHFVFLVQLPPGITARYQAVSSLEGNGLLFPRSCLARLDNCETVSENIPAVDNLQTQRDRKSTRLNSSHVAISYAVF